MTLRKNVASQHVPFGMVSSTTGLPLAGLTVTAKLTQDGGASATASGAVSDVGDGLYDWAPSQGDTNCVAMALMFSATGAVAVPMTIFTTALNPGDAVRFGMTALPNAAANAAGGLPVSIAGALDLDEMNVDIEAIQAKTDNLPSDPADASDIAALFATNATSVAAVKTDTAAVKVQTDKLVFTVANVLNVNVLRIKGTVVNGDGGATPWGP